MATKAEQCKELIEIYTRNHGSVTGINFLDKSNLSQLSPEWAPVVHALDDLRKSIQEEPAKW